jgi:hypothetical protein
MGWPGPCANASLRPGAFLKQATLTVDRLWNGAPARPQELARLQLRLDASTLEVDVVAPFHGDTAPAGPSGSLDRLWEYEVVELFLLGDDGRYLELELGPHGHYLVLQLQGARNVQRSGLPIAYEAERRDALWNGRARLPAALLPEGLHAANGYAIHGEGTGRRYLAAWPVPGEAPDFHRLDGFRPIPWRS